MNTGGYSAYGKAGLCLSDLFLVIVSAFYYYFIFLNISSMPSKTSKSSSVARPRGKGSQDDLDDEMKEIKTGGEVRADDQDALQTNGKKQRLVISFTQCNSFPTDW